MLIEKRAGTIGLALLFGCLSLQKYNKIMRKIIINNKKIKKRLDK